MKTIVTNVDNVSVHLFDISQNVYLDGSGLHVDDLVLPEFTPENSTLVDVENTPEDWYGCAYLYSNGQWSKNPNDPTLNA